MSMLGQLLFWLHLGVIGFAISAGLFLSLPIVLALILLHRLHLHVVGGCAFTLMKKRLGSMPREVDFLQYASQKLFGRHITDGQSQLIDYSIAGLSLFVALTKHMLS